MKKAVLVMCGMVNEIIEETEKPVEISFRKDKGLDGKIEVKFVGPSGGVFAGLCGLVSSGLESLHPDDKGMQKEVLKMLYESVMEELELKHVGTKKAYGPISPDEVDW